MGKPSQYIKGTIVGEFWCKESKKGAMYLSGKLSAEHGAIRVTLFKKYSKEDTRDADYILITYPTGNGLALNAMNFSAAKVDRASSTSSDDEGSDYSSEDLERWLAEKDEFNKDT